MYDYDSCSLLSSLFCFTFTFDNNVTCTSSSRFWLEPLEPIWQYRGKYYLGKTDDVEDKDQVGESWDALDLYL